ncbi:MAG: DUF169 domain-containing protein [Sebaldella sp.]|nr:DUF169 domain-containing protein [Sebaldella sp.]
MKTKIDPIESNEWLEILLELKRKAVGIRFLFNKEDYEISDALSRVGTIPYCTAVRNATKGSSLKLNLNNFACLSAARALGLIETDADSLSGKRHSDMGVYENILVSRNIAKDMVYCKHSVYGVEIRPLGDFREYKPDIVILITSPYNSMRIVQAHAYTKGQLKNIKMAGMQAICQECTSYVFERNEINLSMLCSGTRCVSQWSKDELGVGIPFQQIDDVIYGLMQTMNPMENNEDKKIIQAKLESSGKKLDFEIEYNKNYYTGVFLSKGIKGNDGE